MDSRNNRSYGTDSQRTSSTSQGTSSGRTTNRISYDARESRTASRADYATSRSDRTTSRSRYGERDSRTSRRTPQGNRDIYVGGKPTTRSKLGAILPDNIWLNRVIALVVLVLLVFILFNVVTCIGGAIFPASSSQESSSAEQDANAASGQSVASVTMGTEGVESPWTDNGRFSTGDSALDEYIKKLCDSHTESGATFDKGAYDTYIYVSRTDYVERENNQSPWGETWDVEYAKQYFEEGEKGNCYNFAAVTEYVLKYFGYSDAEAEPCIVKLESGAWGDHGLVFVTNKVDGKQCMVDDALSADGWMLDINSYDFDVRNIAQNSTIKGNVDAIDDDPMPIPPGELTEESSSDSANADETSEGYEDAEGTGESAYDGDGEYEEYGEYGEYGEYEETEY